VSNHKKNKKMRLKSLGLNLLQTFKWLAICRFQDLSGAWFALCTLFKTSDEGGGRAGVSGSSGNQMMGAPVNRPLRNCSDLTCEGCLEVHEKNQCHRTCAIRAAYFLPCIQATNQTFDVRTVISEAHKIKIEQNHSALRLIIDTVQLCAVQNIALCGHHENGPVDTFGNLPTENDGSVHALLCAYVLEITFFKSTRQMHRKMLNIPSKQFKTSD
jgi:hypothetical protein